jgi:hypothetical protein
MPNASLPDSWKNIYKTLAATSAGTDFVDFIIQCGVAAANANGAKRVAEFYSLVRNAPYTVSSTEVTAIMLFTSTEQVTINGNPVNLGLGYSGILEADALKLVSAIKGDSSGKRVLTQNSLENVQRASIPIRHENSPGQDPSGTY